VVAVHLLVNAGNAYKRFQDQDLPGTVIGRVILWFTGGVSQEVRLVLGENVREWAPGNRPGELVDYATDPLSRESWATKNGTQYMFLMDQLEIPIQARFASTALDRIVITKDTQPNTPQDVLAFSIFAITIER
jgi:hypothetical protein